MAHSVESIEAQLLRVASRIFYSVVVAIFGAGIFFGVVNYRMGDIQNDIEELKSVLVEDVQTRVRAIENRIAAGILPTAERKIDELERRLRAVEQQRKTERAPK